MHLFNQVLHNVRKKSEVYKVKIEQLKTRNYLN